MNLGSKIKKFGNSMSSAKETKQPAALRARVRERMEKESVERLSIESALRDGRPGQKSAPRRGPMIQAHVLDALDALLDKKD